LIDPLSPGTILAQFNGSQLLDHYTYGVGLVSQVAASGSSAYYDFDAIDSTVGMTGASGRYVNRYTYGPFGQTTTITASLDNPFTYVGQWGVMNDGSGLLQMRARSYDPSTGQFVSDDPLGLAGGTVNVRSYVANSPVNYADPSGTSGQSQPNKYNPGNTTPYPYGPPRKNNPITIDCAGRQVLHYGSGDFFGFFDRGYVVDEEDSENYYFSGDNNQEYSQPKSQVPRGGDPPNASSGPGDPCCAPPLPGTLPPVPSSPVASGGTLNGLPFDPNALIGPAGYGTVGFIQPSSAWPYTVEFENDGSLAALGVTITEQLNPSLDWSMLQLGSFGFGSVRVNVPAGLTEYGTTIPYQNVDRSALNVQVALNFDVQTGFLTATFTSLDPITGQAPTALADGFLPPDDESGIGEGYIQYTVQAKSGLATGTTVSAQASVVFDTNAAIATNTAANTVDTTVPTSSVAALPAIESSPSFLVRWSGSDGKGSGIASYNVYVSNNGGAYVLWQSDTTKTSAIYAGQIGHTYRFYSVATSNIGLVQPTPATAQATTMVAPPLVTLTKVKEVANKQHQVTELLLTFSGAVNSKEAASTGTYRLATPGKGGSYTAKNAGIIKLKSAVYSAPNDTVALTTSKPVTVTKPVQILVYGTGPTGLKDTFGRQIDGADNGKAGSNAIAILAKNGVTIDAVLGSHTSRDPMPVAFAVDMLLERGELKRASATLSLGESPK
jgi:RHS repeat-associated protein